MLATFAWLFLTMSGVPQAAPRGVAVSGVAQDQTGAVLPGAEVALLVPGLPTPFQQPGMSWLHERRSPRVTRIRLRY